MNIYSALMDIMYASMPGIVSMHSLPKLHIVEIVKCSDIQARAWEQFVLSSFVCLNCVYSYFRTNKNLTVIISAVYLGIRFSTNAILFKVVHYTIDVSYLCSPVA